MKLKYDFHIHSCLSPCCDEDMTPANVANMAALAGLEAVALADHNSAKNCPAFVEAAGWAGLLALPAMELTTAEEVHLLCLLPDLRAAEELDRYVYERLPDVKNRPDVFGSQLVMDGGDRVLGREERLLLNAAAIGVYEAAELLRSLGGLAIPAHIDRASFSVLSNLGSMPAELGFKTAELSRAADWGLLRARQPGLAGVAVIVDSDAHRLTEILAGEYELEVDRAEPGAVIEALRLRRGLPLL
jgi:hypothetical protein